MDSFNFYNIKAEKANANQLSRKIANLFRLIEVLFVLVLISRLSLTIPTVFKNMGGFLRNLSSFLFSSRFVFVLGNLIVVVLFAKSGQFTLQHSGKKKSNTRQDDLYNEFLQRSMKSGNSNTRVCNNNSSSSRTKESDEKIIKRSQDHNRCGLEIHSNKQGFVRRSNSEVFSNSATKSSSSSSCRVLKRSETEKIGKMVVHGSNIKVVDRHNDDNKGGFIPEDLMSNEEFQRKVESFIARQQRFRMEEEFSGDEID